MSADCAEHEPRGRGSRTVAHRNALSAVNAVDDVLREFLAEAGEGLELAESQLVALEQNCGNAAILNGIFRLVHTIKGTCGFIGLPRLAAVAHAAETLLDRFRQGAPVTSAAVGLLLRSVDRMKAILAGIAESGGREPAGSDRDLIEMLERASAPRSRSGATAPAVADEAAPASALSSRSVRVELEALEHLNALAAELVQTRNQLTEIAHRPDSPELKLALQRLSTVTADILQAVTRTRLQPIGSAWGTLPRLTRDLAQELGKQIELRMVGADLEIDRRILGLIKDPLTHMVRNACDHGLEQPQERRAAGKPEKGTIRLSARQERGDVVIDIADDGRGLDTARIRRKALENQLADEAELARMSDDQLHRIIYHPGFSTAEEVTSVSGRGVGMDVVRSNVELLGGAVDVRSAPGQGTTFSIRIPLRWPPARSGAAADPGDDGRRQRERSNRRAALI